MTKFPAQATRSNTRITIGLDKCRNNATINKLSVYKLGIMHVQKFTTRNTVGSVGLKASLLTRAYIVDYNPTVDVNTTRGLFHKVLKLTMDFFNSPLAFDFYVNRLYINRI
jgi:hypothetical protein